MFAKRLKACRTEIGYTQRDLAILTDIHVTQISHFECGTRTPSYRNLCKIVKELGITSDYLLGINKTSSVDWDKRISKLSPKYQKYVYDIIKIFEKGD